MDPAEYARFTEELRHRLEDDRRVLGLVLLGSTAGSGGREPDRWSDHDFFVIVEDGSQEELRTRLDWLPRSDLIAFSYRETAHGVKVLYRDGHLLEFAVFSPDEISVARVNVWRVAFDRERVAQRMAEVERATAAAAPASNEWLTGQFLTALVVGTARDARGEHLSGRQLVKSAAVSHLLTLLGRKPATPGLLDDLDSARRFETAFPALGAELDEILNRDTRGAALGLLAVAQRELGNVVPRAGVAAVRRALA